MGFDLIEKMEQLIKGSKIIDLSYTLEQDMPVWPTHPRFGTVVYESYEKGGVSFHRQIMCGEHSGTHIDAPKHFIRGGCAIDEIEVTSVIGRGVMIDATVVEPCQVYTLEALEQFETKNGPLKEGDIVMFHFGWEEKYGLGTEAEEFLHDWPGVSAEVAEYMVKKKVASVGSDALSIDCFGGDNFPCHEILLGAGIPIMENLTNLGRLPIFSYVIGLASKIKGGSGSPIRIIALIEKEERKEECKI